MKLNLRAPIGLQLGYGIVSWEIAQALHNLGTELIYHPIGQPQVTQKEAPLVQKWINNREFYSSHSPTISIWHQHDLFTRISREVNGALTFFEKDKLTNLEIESLNTQDFIVAPCEFIKNAIESDKRFKREVKHITMGVDSDFFRPIEMPDNGRPYRFAVIGKLEKRKSHDIIHELFSRAFNKNDDVELFVSWDNPFLQEDEKKYWEKLYKESTLGDKIEFIPRMGREQLPQLYNMVDCVLCLSRAEGLDLVAMEAMSCGKPLIVTNYSAHTDYCTLENSLLVDIDETEPAYDGHWFDGMCGSWAKMGDRQEEQIIDYMRKCYKTRYNNNIQGRQDMLGRAWSKTAEKILECY